MSNIRVFAFLADPLIYHKLEGVSHPSSIATKVPILLRAVNQLLLGEGCQSSTIDFGQTFKSTNSRESPTRSTWSLSFDWSYCPLSSPVNVPQPMHIGLALFRLNLIISDRKNCRTQIKLGELLLGKVCKQIDSHFISFTGISIVSIDLSNILIKDFSSVKILGIRAICLGKLCFPQAKGIDF